jgi:hypothetical protein
MWCSNLELSCIGMDFPFHLYIMLHIMKWLPCVSMSLFVGESGMNFIVYGQKM